MTKKYDGGGVIWGAPTSYASAGGTNVLSPIDLNQIQQNYSNTFPMDLDFMDMLEQAADRHDPNVTTDFDRKVAAENYANALDAYMGSANSTNKVALDEAKQGLIDAGVGRDDFAGITTNRFPEGIS